MTTFKAGLWYVFHFIALMVYENTNSFYHVCFFNAAAVKTYMRHRMLQTLGPDGKPSPRLRICGTEMQRKEWIIVTSFVIFVDLKCLKKCMILVLVLRM